MRTGISADTGKVIEGWDHCVQSIRRLLTTRFKSRVMRRHLGSLVPELQDANASALTIFKYFVAVAEALSDPDGGEPGFDLKTIEMVEYGRSGRFSFRLGGIFYPYGHLGDYSVAESKTFSLAEGRLA